MEPYVHVYISKVYLAEVDWYKDGVGIKDLPYSALEGIAEAHCLLWV